MVAWVAERLRRDARNEVLGHGGEGREVFDMVKQRLIWVRFWLYQYEKNRLKAVVRY